MFTVRRYVAVVLASTLLLLAAVVLADLLICSKCGYENPDDTELCTHCEAKLPEARDKGQNQDQSPDDEQYSVVSMLDGEQFYLDPGVVQEEVRTGAEHYKKGDIEVAQMFFKNAAALDLLTDPKIKSTWAERIMQVRKKTESITGTAYNECPVCEGTGKASTRKVISKVCRKCGGTGSVLSMVKLSDRKFRIGRALRRYKALQGARRRVSVGEAWVPADVEMKLSARQRARLKRATAPPCSHCMGTGLSACKRCGGSGYVKCSNSKCDNGLVEVELGGDLEGLEPVVVKKPCETCRGTSVIRCSTCKSRGTSLCPKCEGSGERDDCRKCGGEGFMECGKCDGTGVYKKAPCRKCKANGFIECSSCHGDGRKR